MIDAGGKWVTPGIISAFSRIGIVEVDAENTTDDTSAGESDYSVALDAADGFNPDATAIAVTRIEGITRIVVAPEATSNLFAGQGFIADTSGSVDTEIDRKAFLLVSMGEQGASREGRALRPGHSFALRSTMRRPIRPATLPAMKALRWTALMPPRWCRPPRASS